MAKPVYDAHGIRCPGSGAECLSIRCSNTDLCVKESTPCRCAPGHCSPGKYLAEDEVCKPKSDVPSGVSRHGD